MAVKCTTATDCQLIQDHSHILLGREKITKKNTPSKNTPPKNRLNDSSQNKAPKPVSALTPNRGNLIALANRAVKFFQDINDNPLPGIRGIHIGERIITTDVPNPFQIPLPESAELVFYTENNRNDDSLTGVLFKTRF